MVIVIRHLKNFWNRTNLVQFRKNDFQQLAIEMLKVKHGVPSEIFESMFV